MTIVVVGGDGGGGDGDGGLGDGGDGDGGLGDGGGGCEGGNGGRPVMMSAVIVEPLRSAWSRVASAKSILEGA